MTHDDVLDDTLLNIVEQLTEGDNGSHKKSHHRHHHGHRKRHGHGRHRQSSESSRQLPTGLFYVLGEHYITLLFIIILLFLLFCNFDQDVFLMCRH